MIERATSTPPGITTAELDMRGSYLTKDGRPLRENGAHESLIERQKAQGIRMDMVANRYTDSRGIFPDRPMNGSAYEKIKEDKQAIFDGFAFLNHLYFAGEQPDAVSIRNIYELSVIGAWLPSYLVLRAENSVRDDDLPDVFGGIHKASEGIRSITSKLVQAGQENKSVTPAIIYEVANSLVTNGETSLVGSHEVCPAPPKLIMDTVGAMGWQEGGEYRKSELAETITPEEFPRMQAFSTTAAGYMFFSEVARDMYDLFSDVQRKELVKRINEETRLVGKKINILLGRDPYYYSEQK